MTVYIPIVKAKKYDLKGVSKLKVTELTDVLPLLEIPMPADDWSDRNHVVPHQDKIAYLLSCKITEISKALSGHSYCMDISSWSSGRLCDDGRHIIDHLVSNAQASNSSFSICLNYGAWDDPAYRKTLTRNSNHIKILRLESYAIADSADDAYFEDQLQDISKVAGLDLSSCIVLIDFSSLLNSDIQDKCQTLRKIIDKVTSLGFVKIAVSGCSIPEQVSDYVGNDSQQLMDRLELKLFDELLKAVSVTSPIFSDYGIRPAASSADFKAPHANAKMRYTIAGGYLLLRGVSKQVIRLKLQHPVMADIIKQYKDYKGPMFSWGDSEIFKQVGGGLGEWIAIDTNHHIRFVAVEAATSIASRFVQPNIAVGTAN